MKRGESLVFGLLRQHNRYDDGGEADDEHTRDAAPAMMLAEVGEGGVGE